MQLAYQKQVKGLDPLLRIFNIDSWIWVSLNKELFEGSWDMCGICVSYGTKTFCMRQ